MFDLPCKYNRSVPRSAFRPFAQALRDENFTESLWFLIFSASIEILLSLIEESLLAISCENSNCKSSIVSKASTLKLVIAVNEKKESI